MARINLLPWREERRQELRQQFFGMLAGFVVLAAGLTYLVFFQIGVFIQNQEDRNSFLEQRIAELDRQIKVIEELQETRARLVARMEVIQNLQQSRPLVVHMVFEVADALPDGVYLTGLRQRGGQITIQGRAESNARVSAYMRRLEASDWLGRPQLVKIQAVGNDRGIRANDFTLTVMQESQGPSGGAA